MKSLSRRPPREAENVFNLACGEHGAAERAAKEANIDSAQAAQSSPSGNNQEDDMDEDPTPSQLTEQNLEELDYQMFHDSRLPHRNGETGSLGSLPSTLNPDLSELLWRKRVCYDETEPGHRPDDYEELLKILQVHGSKQSATEKAAEQIQLQQLLYILGYSYNADVFRTHFVAHILDKL